MVLTTSLSELWIVFFPWGWKEQNLIFNYLIIFVVTLKLYLEFRMGQFWVPYLSISISMTYFLT